MAPSYHAHAPAVPLPLALPLLALGPGFEKMFRANISTQHMLETFARLALHDDERHGRRVRRGRAATRDVPSCAPCAVRRLPATFLFLSVFLSCSFSPHHVPSSRRAPTPAHLVSERTPSHQVTDWDPPRHMNRGPASRRAARVRGLSWLRIGIVDLDIITSCRNPEESRAESRRIPRRNPAARSPWRGIPGIPQRNPTLESLARCFGHCARRAARGRRRPPRRRQCTNHSWPKQP